MIMGEKVNSPHYGMMVSSNFFILRKNPVGQNLGRGGSPDKNSIFRRGTE